MIPQSSTHRLQMDKGGIMIAFYGIRTYVSAGIESSIEGIKNWIFDTIKGVLGDIPLTRCDL